MNSFFRDSAWCTCTGSVGIQGMIILPSESLLYLMNDNRGHSHGVIRKSFLQKAGLDLDFHVCLGFC